MKRFNWVEGAEAVRPLFDKLKYVLLVILAGVILMIVPFGAKETRKRRRIPRRRVFPWRRPNGGSRKPSPRSRGPGGDLVLTVKSGNRAGAGPGRGISYQETERTRNSNPPLPT
jgi:hypothetical protein